jgi:hypothetical protein
MNFIKFLIWAIMYLLFYIFNLQFGLSDPLAFLLAIIEGSAAVGVHGLVNSVGQK